MSVPPMKDSRSAQLVDEPKPATSAYHAVRGSRTYLAPASVDLLPAGAVESAFLRICARSRGSPGQLTTSARGFKGAAGAALGPIPLKNSIACRAADDRVERFDHGTNLNVRSRTDSGPSPPPDQQRQPTLSGCTHLSTRRRKAVGQRRPGTSENRSKFCWPALCQASCRFRRDGWILSVHSVCPQYIRLTGQDSLEHDCPVRCRYGGEIGQPLPQVQDAHAGQRHGIPRLRAARETFPGEGVLRHALSLLGKRKQ